MGVDQFGNLPMAAMTKSNNLEGGSKPNPFAKKDNGGPPFPPSKKAKGKGKAPPFGGKNAATDAGKDQPAGPIDKKTLASMVGSLKG
jgi:hypothetical protein